MIDLVSDLLDVARIESGKFVYTVASIDVADLFSEMQTLYPQKSQEKQIYFPLDIPQKGQWFISGDMAKLRIVFQNLLDNAFKFTPAQGTVSFSFAPKEQGIEFTISDSGISTSKEEIPHLFTKFFRARNAVAMDTRGTGLGLYIAFSLVHTHNGTVAVDSELGRGTTFTIVLPKATGSPSTTPL